VLFHSCTNEGQSDETVVDREVMGLEALLGPLQTSEDETRDETVTDSLLLSPPPPTQSAPSNPSVNEESLTLFEAALGLLPPQQQSQEQRLQVLFKEDEDDEVDGVRFLSHDFIMNLNNSSRKRLLYTRPDSIYLRIMVTVNVLPFEDLRSKSMKIIVLDLSG